MPLALDAHNEPAAQAANGAGGDGDEEYTQIRARRSSQCFAVGQRRIDNGEGDRDDWKLGGGDVYASDVDDDDDDCEPSDLDDSSSVEDSSGDSF